MVELLCPAGSPKAMEAAVNAGADAVYFGGSALNARQAAVNFTDAELEKWVSYCHKRGVKCYLTLNTVVSDREIRQMADYIKFITDCGVDAVIVQSLGLVDVIRELSPQLEIHASTQMAIHNLSGVKVAEDMGCSRVVVARELSGENLDYICKNSRVEIESFIHGALCMSYSGQCYMSAFIGSRSGNRGSCAQPCRQNYKGGYRLSLKDLCVAESFTDFLSTGAKSLKIEGRLKSPEYVGGVASIYRRLIDEKRNATEKEISDLRRLFSRSGFTNGYFKNQKGSSMFGIRTEKDKQMSKGFSLKVQSVKPKAQITVPERETTSALPELKGYKYKKSVYNFHFMKESQIPDKKYSDLANHIWLPLFEIKNFKDERLGAVLPTVIFDSQIEVIKKKLIETGVKKALCRNINHIALCLELGIEPHGAFSMNFFNSYDLAAAKRLGLKETAVSVEAKLAQIRDMKKPMPVNAVVYGKIPVMTTHKCIIKDTAGCDKCRLYLKDRMDASFFCEGIYGHLNIIYNSVPIYMADKTDTLSAFSHHFIFTDESRAQCEEIINAYKNGYATDKKIKRIK